jgi:hypothetical protein
MIDQTTSSPLDAVERQFCAALQHEGIGTLYERIVKGRMLRQLNQRHAYTSILELGCAVTKGYDNLAFLGQELDVTIADANIDMIQAHWPFSQRPTFCTLDAAPPADLVWSFARVQLDPAVLDTMLEHTRRHVLVFVPNILNPGAPVHAAFHAFTKAACQHAERGNARLRTRAGLVKLLDSRGVRVLDSGYIDAPPIPNIAFSIDELKRTMGWSANGAEQARRPAVDPSVVWRRMQALTRFETLPVTRPLRPILGHHIFAFGALP